MHPGARVAATLGAFAFACVVDAGLWTAWSALCRERCAMAAVPATLAYVLLLPFASAGLAAWATARPGALRRAMPGAATLGLLAAALTVALAFMRGHAHGG